MGQAQAKGNEQTQSDRQRCRNPLPRLPVEKQENGERAPGRHTVSEADRAGCGQQGRQQQQGTGFFISMKDCIECNHSSEAKQQGKINISPHSPEQYLVAP